MFPFVILSQKQRIKRYNLQFGGKEKHCTSLQSLKTFFAFQKAERQIWWLALKCSDQELYYPTHPPLHWELRLIQQVRYSKSPTVALHKFIGGLKPSLVATCLRLHTQYAPEVWGRWQRLDPTRKGTTLSTNNIQSFCWQVPTHSNCPRQGSLLVRSTPSFACTLQRLGITRTQPLQNRVHWHTEEMPHCDPGLQLEFRARTSFPQSISLTNKIQFYDITTMHGIKKSPSQSWGQRKFIWN